MKRALIDKITARSEFFDSGVVLQSEKQQIFQLNSELPHTSAFNKSDKAHDAKLHPQFDPVTANPTKDFFTGLFVDPKVVNVALFKTEYIKFHIGLIKPAGAAKGTRLWLLAGKKLFMTLSQDSMNFEYYNALDANVRERYFSIRDMDVVHKFTIKSTDLTALKEVTKLFSNVYTMRESQSFEWFFSSICATKGFPPVSRFSFGFYRSLLEHPHFLFLFALLVNKSTIQASVLDAWISCAHDSLPTLIPCLLQFYFHDVNNESNLVKNCFVAQIIGQILAYDPAISPKLSNSKSVLELLSILENSTLTPASRFALFSLFNETFRKFGSKMKCASVLTNLIAEILKSPIPADPNLSKRALLIVEKFCVFPEDFKLYMETVATTDHLVSLMNCVFENREALRTIAHNISFNAIVPTLEAVFISDFSVISPDPPQSVESPIQQPTEASEISSHNKLVKPDPKDLLTHENQAPEPEKVHIQECVQHHRPIDSQAVHVVSTINDTTSAPPCASTNNMETSEKQEIQKPLIVPAPPLSPPKSIATENAKANQKTKLTEEKKKSNVNHIPNYTVDESEDATEYSFESKVSQPIKIPPKPIPQGFESDSSDSPPPKQKVVPLKPPTKEQLEQVVGALPNSNEILPPVPNKDFYHTLSSGDEDEDEENQPPLNANEAHFMQGEAPLDFGDQIHATPTAESQQSTNSSIPIQLSELKAPINSPTPEYSGTSYTPNSQYYTSTQEGTPHKQNETILHPPEIINQIENAESNHEEPKQKTDDDSSSKQINEPSNADIPHENEPKNQIKESDSSDSEQNRQIENEIVKEKTEEKTNTEPDIQGDYAIEIKPKDQQEQTNPIKENQSSENESKSEIITKNEIIQGNLSFEDPNSAKVDIMPEDSLQNKFESHSNQENIKIEVHLSDQSKEYSNVDSRAESRSIRSTADIPNYDSIDTNTESPNIYTHDNDDDNSDYDYEDNESESD